LAPQVQFEYTAPDTPQQNGRVERKFATLYAAKEVKFVFQVLRSMSVKADLPIIVHVNNVGAIFLLEQM
jgi:hypothetical protein